MAGTAVAGELSGARARGGPAVGFRFAVATRADDAELRAFLRDMPTPGGVSLAATREPDYFAGEGAGGAKDTTIIARLDGRLVCMGRCSRRKMYAGGSLREVGYLGELRLAPGTPRGLEALRQGYAFFTELERAYPADAYFTCVANKNIRARSVLEGGRLGLPDYRPAAELRTLAWPAPRRARRLEGPDVTVELGELIAFLDAQARRRALTTPWSAASVGDLGRHGLRAEDFRVVRESGRIVAAAALWDQSAWRQTVVAGYARGPRLARPWINLALRLAGRAGLPPPGGVLRRACVHGLAVAEGAERRLPELCARLEATARRRGVAWLVVTLDARDEGLRAALPKRVGAQVYATRLHLVGLPGFPEAAWSGDELVRPEAGWL